MWKRIQNLIQHRPKTVLFFVFILTIPIRLPQLTRPLSKHHELNTAAVLVCLQVWNEQGLTPSKASPIQFFPGTYNFFNDSKNKFKNLQSSGAYLSMGAGSYLLPWLAMKLLHFNPSPLSLRIWMLLVEVISVYLLYGLLLFLKKSFFNAYKNYAFIGCVLFLTMPVVMWYLGNSYSHETMVLPFYLAVLWLGFIIQKNNYQWNFKQYIGYGICVALAVYTDWLGVIAAFVFFVQAISIKKNKERLPFLVVNACAVILPTIIIFWQYISLIGWQEYSNFITAQFARRSFPGAEVQYSIIDYIKHFATGYGMLCIIALVGISLARKKLHNYFTVLAAIPLLHYIIFRGFSNEHDYSVLKWAPFLIITALAGLDEFSLFWQKAALTFIIISSIVIYHFINPPFIRSFNGERYVWMKEIGQRIATEAKPDEYVFINTQGYLHQVEWYAHRNYKPVVDTAEVRFWLRQQPENKAVFFKLNDQQQITETIRMQK
jgi:hypothetical protein